MALNFSILSLVSFNFLPCTDWQLRQRLTEYGTAPGSDDSYLVIFILARMFLHSCRILPGSAAMPAALVANSECSELQTDVPFRGGNPRLPDQSYSLPLVLLIPHNSLL